MLEEKGFGHLYADKDSGEFLGAELMAPHADHLAHLLAWAIEMRVTVFEILSFPFYHPVLEEGLRTGFRALARQVSKKAPPLEIKAAP
jgi:dihydrolipoamide dehydrogenase